MSATKDETAASDDEQTSVFVFDRHLLLRASGRLRLRRGLGRCVAQVPLGGNRGGNQVGTNRVPSWPLMSLRVTPENGGVQAIPRGERGSRLLGRPPTEPKVTGSNPVGRVSESRCQRKSGRLPNALGWHVGFHTLRHTCASLLVESELSVPRLQRWTGPPLARLHARDLPRQPR